MKAFLGEVGGGPLGRGREGQRPRAGRSAVPRWARAPSRARSGLPPGAQGARSGSGPLALFPRRHEQGPACRHSPGAAGARPGQCGHCLGAANPAGGQVGGTRRRRRASRSGRGGLPGRGLRPGGRDARLPGGLAASPPRGGKWRGAGRRRRERRGSDVERCLRKEERGQRKDRSEASKKTQGAERRDAGRERSRGEGRRTGRRQSGRRGAKRVQGRQTDGRAVESGPRLPRKPLQRAKVHCCVEGRGSKEPSRVSTA